MGLIVRVIITALLVMLCCYVLPGVNVDGFMSAVWVAIVLSLMNFVVKPLLVLFTLPLTVLTFGLFLLVINALIIQLVAYFVGGFHVDSFWYAMLFSVVLTFVQSIAYSVLEKKV